MNKDTKGNVIEIGGLYKLKEGKSLDYIDEMLVKTIRFLGYIKNPLNGEDEYYIRFSFVSEKTIEPVSRIFPDLMLPYDTFFEYFDIYKSNQEVNKIIYKLLEEREN